MVQSLITVACSDTCKVSSLRDDIELGCYRYEIQLTCSKTFCDIDSYATVYHGHKKQVLGVYEIL